MGHVPHWVGTVGLVLGLLFCGAFLAGEPFLALFLMLLALALVVVESRYERGLMGTRRD